MMMIRFSLLRRNLVRWRCQHPHNGLWTFALSVNCINVTHFTTAMMGLHVATLAVCGKLQERGSRNGSVVAFAGKVAQE
jgi:hypothetical protein